MEWLEIISLRTSSPFEHQARKFMKKFCEIVKKHNLSEADFYVHESIPGDFAIIIKSRTEKDRVGGTELGLYMTEALKQFGLVDYNCWRPVDDK